MRFKKASKKTTTNKTDKEKMINLRNPGPGHKILLWNISVFLAFCCLGFYTHVMLATAFYL